MKTPLPKLSTAPCPCCGDGMSTSSSGDWICFTCGTVLIKDHTTLNDHQVRTALAPVIDWFQSDEQPERPTMDILREVVKELVEDRHQLLAIQRILGGAFAATELPDTQRMEDEYEHGKNVTQ